MAGLMELILMLLLAGIVGILIGIGWMIVGSVTKKPHYGGRVAGISALVFLMGIGLLYTQLQELDKSDMAESEPLSASSTIEEQVAEAQKIRQEQYRADELVNTLTLINSSEASLAVKQLAQEEWPDNRRLQDDFSEKQMTALSELSAMEIDAPHKETLLNNAIQEMVPSFRNMHSEYMDQLAAYEEINNSRLPPLEKRLIEIAKVDYPDNYIVIRHEYRRQLQAYQWIEAQTLDTEAKRLAMADAKAEWDEDYAISLFMKSSFLKLMNETRKKPFLLIQERLFLKKSL